jgi:LemA protein
LIAVIFVGKVLSTYNAIESLDEHVKQTWADVENQYQRRYDLIPNLVKVVERFAVQEKEIFTQVAEARAKVGSINISADNLNPAIIQQFQEAQGALGAALSRLIAVQESYPELKSNENFGKLQDQLEGTENRISTARTTYTKAVNAFNSLIRGWFARWVNDNFNGLPRANQFKSDEGANQAPQVNFNN